MEGGEEGEGEGEESVESPPSGFSLNLAPTTVSSHRYVQQVKEILEFSERVFKEDLSNGWNELASSDPTVKLLQKLVPKHPLVKNLCCCFILQQKAAC